MGLRGWLADRFSSKKSLGDRGEVAAARYLKRSGFRILERSHDSPLVRSILSQSMAALWFSSK
jgi:hypothetical protein